ncbi:sulfite exporter TauE/SafE family protein [Thermoactinospora rubra]|uniref:urease accessory protein UreH domain-containing protein n=1 Tax=Thermoactinospora rubra TaxID=1088767 RepID=UPI000A10D650|nr:sulfite exporter TauE/SafE family protein [Thermoactinospora rubra]
MEALTLFAGGLAAGLVAGLASCTAVQGGLLAGLAQPPCEHRPDQQAGQRTGRPADQRADRSADRQAPGRSADRWAVGRFLAGRFCSHVLAGALLGLLGSAVSLPPAARAVTMVVAGCAVAGFGVRLMRRRPACRPRPPARLGAFLLGAATILVPCGVTLGVELTAVSSGTALGGAAAMAGFALGTAPALALLGLLLRGLSRTWLALAAGAAAVAVGVWTVGSGLGLGGWLPRPDAPAAAAPSGRITVHATRDGYRPGIVTAPAGVPVELVFAVAEAGCTGTVAIDGRDVRLPATVRLPPRPPGTLRYSCSMGMYQGFVRFVAAN